MSSDHAGVYPCVRSVKVGERTARFRVETPDDLIQAHFVRGEFAKGPFLLDLLNYLPRGATVPDIGANVGNHTVWFAAFAGARKVIAFELNPPAIELLRANVALNELDNVDLSFLGVGCGAAPVRVVIGNSLTNNLGATAFYAAPPNSQLPTFEVDSIDRMLPGESVDFVKIDVEGMELSVLLGMSELIARCRPSIYLEIWHMSLAGNLRFLDWLARNDYCIKRQHGPNFLCTAIEKDGAGALVSKFGDDPGFADFDYGADDSQKRRAVATLADQAATKWRSPFLVHHAAHVLLHHGDPEVGLALVDEACRRAGDHLAFLQTRVALADRLARTDEIVATMKRMAVGLPRDQMSATRLADLLWQSGCSPEATRCVKMALL